MKAFSRRYPIATTVSNRLAGTHRKTSIVVGTLFLISTAAFMAGSRLIASYFSGDNTDKARDWSLVSYWRAIAGLL